MPSCEKCWADAYDPYQGITQVEKYQQLLKERGNNTCSPKERAGQWWDDEHQCDTRITLKADKRSPGGSEGDDSE